MSKLVGSVLLCSIFCSTFYYGVTYTGSSTAAVTLAGAVVSAKHIKIDKKYKRKDCPVCKGKGWYISGDGIEKIDCQYCEPESTLKAEKAPLIIKR